MDAARAPTPPAEPPALLALREPAPATGPIALRQRRLGVSDLRVFPLALSAAQFGSSLSDRDSHGILDAYRELGGDVLDTTAPHDDGVCETTVGRWMHDRRVRDEVVVAAAAGRGGSHPGVTVRALTRSVEESLRRLRTDRIDVLSLDADDESVPFEETLLAVDALVTAGKVRHVALADHSGNRVIEARVIAAQHGATPIVALEATYGLLSRSSFEPVLARVAQHLALGVMPRVALAGSPPARMPRPRTAAVQALLPRPRRTRPPLRLSRRTRRVLRALDGIAAELEVAPAAVELAWLLTKPDIVAPIVTASTPEQVLHLVSATSLQLSRQQVTALDRASEPLDRASAPRERP